jgi:hypothetical protein
MQRIFKRLSSLASLARPLALAFVGIVLLSLGVAYFLIVLYPATALPGPLYAIPVWARGLILVVAGLAVLAAGIWQLSGVAVIPLHAGPEGQEGLVLGMQREIGAPQIAVLSGGAGMLILASLGRHASRLTCITPVQDPVEYYYRASSLFHFEKVYFVAPTPAPIQVEVELDDGTRRNIQQNISHDERLAPRHVTNMFLAGTPENTTSPSVTRLTVDALAEADAIILGPGSLFESVIPNLLLPDVRQAIKHSKARKIYICNLMTEPGLTTGLGVTDHIQQIVRFGGFAPDYVLVNAQRIQPEVRQIYAAANQNPVYLTPEEYEETAVSVTDRVIGRDVVLEGAVVMEADLASAMFESIASLERPGESRTVRVLRHDPDKLASAILEILRRE